MIIKYYQTSATNDATITRYALCARHIGLKPMYAITNILLLLLLLDTLINGGVCVGQK